jgi:putative peptide zinc metalloprotease protein
MPSPGSAATIASAAPPVPRSDAELHLFPGGAAGSEYLLEVGGDCYTVNTALRTLIDALREEPRSWDELAAGYAARTGRPVSGETLRGVVASALPANLFDAELDQPRAMPFVVSATLLPAPAVVWIAERLRWAYSRPVVWAVLAAFAATLLALLGDVSAALAAGPWDDGLFLVAAVMGSILLHELGHAAACARYGCAPGRIGAGIYLVWPALFTDVTRAWRLPRRQRAVVDLGGLYFQCALVSAVGAYVLATGSIRGLHVLALTLLLMVHSLNPILKLDGYWLLTDLAGIRNLHDRVVLTMRRALGREPRGGSGDDGVPERARWVLYAYTAGMALYVVYMGYLLSVLFPQVLAAYPARAAQLGSEALHAAARADYGAAALAVVTLLKATVVPLVVCVMLWRTGAQVVRARRDARLSAR